MRYFYDCEFLEDGRTIEPISIGIVREDGAEYYAVNRDAPWKRIADHDWLCANVVRWLPRIHGDRRLQVSARRNPFALDFDDPSMKSIQEIAGDLIVFFGDDQGVELWADCGAYDHVMLMQLYGPMIDKPAALPYFTCDLQQVLRAVTPRGPLPPEPENAHNALADAWHLCRTFHAVFGSTPPMPPSPF